MIGSDTVPRRITVVAPKARLDVALPVQSTVAEVLPQLVRMIGSDTEAATGGWKLGRLGGPTLGTELTVAEAGIRDGELLYLNPAEQQFELLLFDDVVDAIASAAEQRKGNWRPALSRRLGIGAAAIAFAATQILVALSIRQWPIGPAVVSGLALILLAAGGALARAYGDATIGAPIAASGLPGALIAGATALGPDSAGPGPAALALGFAALTLYAVLAAVAVAYALAWFAGVAVAAGIGGIAAAASLVTGAKVSTVAIIAVTLVILLSPALPMLALRVGRLPLPQVPTDTAQFRRDERPVLGPEVVNDTDTAAAVLTGLLGAVAAVVAVGAIALLTTDSAWAWALAGVAGMGLLLRARAYLGVGQRGAFLLAGIGVLLGTASRLASTGDGVAPLALLAIVSLSGVICTAYALRSGDDTSSSPYWTRILDMVEFLVLMSLVPVAAAALGVYASLRGIGG